MMGWLQFERFDGDLASVLQKRASITYIEMLGVLGQVLKALQDLHVAGVIHRWVLCCAALR
jgi:serine/threonine protein kinase